MQVPHRPDTLGNCFGSVLMVSMVILKGDGHAAVCFRKCGEQTD